jgi:alpha-mannosidase
MTNFKASQGGPAAFRFSLTSRSGGSDPVLSTRFGWEVHAPLLASWIPEDSRGTLDARTDSFFGLDKINVIIQAVKLAEDGEGMVIRLREIAGQAAEVLLSSPLFRGPGVSAWLSDLAEKNEDPARLSEMGISIPIKAFGIQTVRVMRPR